MSTDMPKIILKPTLGPLLESLEEAQKAHMEIGTAEEEIEKSIFFPFNNRVPVIIDNIDDANEAVKNIEHEIRTKTKPYFSNREFQQIFQSAETAAEHRFKIEEILAKGLLSTQEPFPDRTSYEINSNIRKLSNMLACFALDKGIAEQNINEFFEYLEKLIVNQSKLTELTKKNAPAINSQRNIVAVSKLLKNKKETMKGMTKSLLPTGLGENKQKIHLVHIARLQSFIKEFAASFSETLPTKFIETSITDLTKQIKGLSKALLSTESTIREKEKQPVLPSEEGQ